MVGIYKITNPKKKIYIGQSIDIDRRWRDYKNLNCDKQPKIYNSLVKYGVENHIFEIITECCIENLNDFERYYQELYNCIGNSGLNCNLVETDNLKKEMSIDTRFKMSHKAKTRVFTEERREEVRQTMKKLHIEGKLKIGIRGEVMSEEKKEKIRIGNLGKKCTEESRARMRIAQKGKIITAEARLKSSISHKGNRISEETKIKLSLALKGRKKTKEHIENAANGRKKAELLKKQRKIEVESLRSDNI